MPDCDPTVGPGPPPAGPRDVARLHRGPRRDAVHGRGEPALARGARRRDARGAAPDLDLRPARLPEGAADELPGPGEGPAWGRLPAPDRAAGRERRGAAGGRPDEWSQSQSNLLPVQATDFVFAVLAEELGFIGCIV